MLKKNTLERYLTALLDGNRTGCRAVIEEALQGGLPANAVYMDIIWPVMVEIERLYDEDRIDSAQEAFASRINRTIVDQLQNKLPRKTQRNRKITIVTDAAERSELGGQIVADLFESDGWEVRYLGGSVNNDDILSFIHGYTPDLLLLYGIPAKSAPNVRSLIDTVRSINAFPGMQIMLSGGVFEHAEGLWEEIGADLYATNATDAVSVASADKEDQPKPKRTIKRRRKLPVTEEQDAQVQELAAV